MIKSDKGTPCLGPSAAVGWMSTEREESLTLNNFQCDLGKLVRFFCTSSCVGEQLVTITDTRRNDHLDYQIFQIGSNVLESDLE